MTRLHRYGLIAGLGIVFLALVYLLGSLVPPGETFAQGMQLTPQMMTTSNFMTPPPTVYPPNQVSDGEQVYYYNCMTCHGDRLQGLSQQWRDEIGAPESNCWASHCHASNRTGVTFVFPKNVPALVGPEVLSGFSTALNLHDFIRAQMPFQAPGSLSDAEYWQLTAFIMQQNGVDPGPRPLDAARAAQIRFGGAGSEPAQTGSPWAWIAGGVGVALAAVGIFVWRRGKRGAGPLKRR